MRIWRLASAEGLGLVMLLNTWVCVWRVQKRLIKWARASAEQGVPIAAGSGAADALGTLWTARGLVLAVVSDVIFHGGLRVIIRS